METRVYCTILAIYQTLYHAIQTEFLLHSSHTIWNHWLFQIGFPLSWWNKYMNPYSFAPIAFKSGYYTEMIDWRAKMRRTASPIDWMVMKIRMRTRTKMIRTMTLCGSPSVITYLCQTRATAMFPALTWRALSPQAHLQIIHLPAYGAAMTRHGCFPYFFVFPQHIAGFDMDFAACG